MHGRYFPDLEVVLSQACFQPCSRWLAAVPAFLKAPSRRPTPAPGRSVAAQPKCAKPPQSTITVAYTEPTTGTDGKPLTNLAHHHLL